MVIDKTKKIRQCPKCGETQLVNVLNGYYCLSCKKSFNLNIICLDYHDDFGSLGIFELEESKTKE